MTHHPNSPYGELLSLLSWLYEERDRSTIETGLPSEKRKTFNLVIDEVNRRMGNHPGGAGVLAREQKGYDDALREVDEKAATLNKPPLGIMPQHNWREKRIIELCETIARCCPSHEMSREWIDEMWSHSHWLKDHFWVKEQVKEHMP